MNYPINNSVSGECDVGKRSRGFVGENTMSGWNRKLSLSWYLWPAQSAHPPRTGLSRASAYIWPALPLPVQSCESLLIHKIFEHARTQKFIMHFFRTLFISFFHFFFRVIILFRRQISTYQKLNCLAGWLMAITKYRVF